MYKSFVVAALAAIAAAGHGNGKGHNRPPKSDQFKRLNECLENATHSDGLAQVQTRSLNGLGLSQVGATKKDNTPANHPMEQDEDVAIIHGLPAEAGNGNGSGNGRGNGFA